MTTKLAVIQRPPVLLNRDPKPGWLHFGTLPGKPAAGWLERQPRCKELICQMTFPNVKSSISRMNGSMMATRSSFRPRARLRRAIQTAESDPLCRDRSGGGPPRAALARRLRPLLQAGHLLIQRR